MVLKNSKKGLYFALLASALVAGACSKKKSDDAGSTSTTATTGSTGSGSTAI